MIRRHDFNSEWWGDEVGIVSDPDLFALHPAKREALLRKYAWVEFMQPISCLPERRIFAQCGFFHADTQVRFRISLVHAKSVRSGEVLQVDSAAKSPFEVPVADLRPFSCERFYVLPGACQSRVSARYALWAARLIRESPQTCLQFQRGNEVQGWFLARPEHMGLELTLAALNSRAAISGLDLYSRALAHFGESGFRLGFASFSIANSNVLNIYARLGARFLEPSECWLWIRDSARL